MIKHLFIGYPVRKVESEEHRDLAINAVAIVSSVLVSGFILVNSFKGHYFLASAEVLSLMLFLLCVVPYFKKKTTVKQNLIVAATSILLLALLIDGGVAKVAIFWSLLIPFVACLFLGLPKAWYWILAYAVTVALIFLLHLFWQPFLPYENSVLAYFPFTFIQFSLLAAILQSQFEWSELKYQQSIEDLDGLSKELEEKVHKRTHALEIINKSLQEEIKEHDETAKALHDSEVQVYQMQKMETIGTLVGGIAHDFNNMLAGINANIFMIKRKVTDEPDLLSRTKDIESLVMSASDMIRQLLTFARKDCVEFEQFDLTEFIDESFGLVKVAISERVHMHLDNKQDSLPVYANKTQIQQVVMNMVNNARDASLHAKHPIIRVKLERFKPDILFKKENPSLNAEEYALITIADNGKGIPKEQQEKIFEPFFTTKEVGKGTGLGLAMSCGAIQSHGGTIKVLSKLDKGTVFKIYLPLSDEVEGSTQLEGTIQGEFQSNETLLLVDDDQRLRESQKNVLEALGYTVMEAKHGRQAVTLFEEKLDSIDLVIMDLTMPIMGGAEAARKMRVISDTVKIMFITGYDKNSTISESTALEAGEIILEKPYTMVQLQDAIRNRLITK